MKKTLIIIASVAAFLVLCVLGAELWLKREIRTVIERNIAGTGATVDLGRISVSLPRRSLTVHNIRVRAQNDDPVHRGFTLVSLDVTVGSISVQGISYKRQEGKPAVSAAELVIDSPRATLVTKGAKDAAPGHKKTLRQAVTEKLASLAVDRISVTGATMDYVAWHTDDESTRIALGGAELRAEGFTIDSLPATPEKILFSDNVTLAADSLVYGFGAGAQVLRVDTLALDAAGKTLFMKRFAMIPQFPKHEFAQKSKGHQDWTAATVRDIACTGLDYAGLLAGSGQEPSHGHRRTLSVDNVSIASASVASYKNRKEYQAPRTKPMIWQTIQRLPLALDIRHISFAGVDVEYDELGAEADSPGAVTISGGSGTIKNLTNIAAGHDRFFTVEVAATLMPAGGKNGETPGGRMEAMCLFPVGAADDHWEVTGRVGHTDMASFNRAIEPLMDVRITSGEMQSLDFHLTGTLAESHIRLTMAYSDLKVAFLKKHDHTRRRGFLTFVADDILLRPDNPGRHGNGRLREGEGTHRHDPDRSMYNYIWRSFVPAIVKTVL